MSINVTVHGNPISIKKGRMVTFDADKEFDRRRRIRLQQVRQQSKEIAEDVRNRVREEKNRQIFKTNNVHSKKFNEQQSEKLHALRKEYSDCLQEFGRAHKDATEESDDELKLLKKSNENKVLSDNRGLKANKKRKIDQKLEDEQTKKGINQKKAVRLIEDARSKMVANLKNKKFWDTDISSKRKRKHITANINISGEIVSDTSDNGSDRDHLDSCRDDDDKLSILEENNISAVLLSENGSGDIKMCESSDSDPVQVSVQKDITRPKHMQHSISKAGRKYKESHNSVIKQSEQKHEHSKERDFCNCDLSQSKQSEINDEEMQERIKQIVDTHRQKLYPVDTRISEKIKKRQIPENLLDSDDQLSCDLRHQHTRIKPLCTSECTIPYVSKVTLHHNSEKSVDGETHSAHYYDHFNQYSRTHPANVVQKVSKESIEVCPSSDRSEREFRETMIRRDVDAQCRGMRAMEKERMKKNCERTLKDLSIIQRQERLASIGRQKPRYHMDEDRLREHERKKQHKIENTFENKYFNSSIKKKLISTKPIKKSTLSENLKKTFEILDVSGDSAERDAVDMPVKIDFADLIKASETKKNRNLTKTLTDEKQQLQMEEEDLKQKQQTLQDLLQRVSEQRDLLLSEVSSLPTNSNLHSVLQSCQSTVEEKNKKCTCENKITETSVNVLDSKKSVRGKRINSSSSSSDIEMKQRTSKKVKIKTKKVLIRNEGTQTSPKLNPKDILSANKKKQSPEKNEISKNNTDDKDNADGKRNIDNTENTNNNSSDSDKLCEIIIKMNNDSDVKILQQQISKTQTKFNELKSNNLKKESKQEKRTKFDKEIVLKIKTPEKATSRSLNEISTSTSYFSPPDVQKKEFHDNLKDRRNVKYKDNFNHNKKQTNIDLSHSGVDKEKELNPRVIKYIQKLLNMSRKGIDDLGVSSVSDISTPGPSIVEESRNMPLVQLKNVMKHYDLTFDDIKKYLDVSDISSSNDFSIQTLDEVDQEKKTISETLQKKNISETVEKKTIPGKQLIPETSPKQTKPTQTDIKQTDKNVGTSTDVDKVLQESVGIDINNFTELSYPNMVLKYTELAENCCQRISSLADMIERVRKEKQRLLSPEPSDTIDNSTSYKDLPKTSKKDTKKHKQVSKCPDKDENGSNESLSQETLDKYLLEINLDQRENILKTIPSSGDREHNINLNISVRTETTEEPNETNKGQPNDINKEDAEIFVPFLQGIPKFHEHETSTEFQKNNPSTKITTNLKPRPPPSLLRNVQKHNINLTPHELSTIVEVETIASSRNISEMISHKMTSPASKHSSKNNSVNVTPAPTSASSSSFITLSPDHDENGKVEAQHTEINKVVSVKHKSKSVSKSSEYGQGSSGLQTKHTGTPAEKVSSETSTDKSSSSEDMETILRTLGLGWAVATLKKTQEALALSSSSSSIDNNLKQLSSVQVDSDVSLKDFLKKQFLKKLSSSGSSSSHSSLKAQSIDSFTDLFHYIELQNISAISGESESQHKDGHQKRTSTPVPETRASIQLNEMFESNSDLSSVKIYSEENFQLCAPDVKLDVTTSRNKK